MPSSLDPFRGDLHQVTIHAGFWSFLFQWTGSPASAFEHCNVMTIKVHDIHDVDGLAKAEVFDCGWILLGLVLPETLSEEGSRVLRLGAILLAARVFWIIIGFFVKINKFPRFDSSILLVGAMRSGFILLNVAVIHGSHCLSICSSNKNFSTFDWFSSLLDSGACVHGFCCKHVSRLVVSLSFWAHIANTE